MPATASELQQIARLALRDRLTQADIAKRLGVSQATIVQWMRTPAYLEAMRQMRAQWKQEARARVAGLGDEVMKTLETLMRTSKHDRVKLEAAQTLGEWLGMGEPDMETSGDEREDLVDVLKDALARTAQRPTVVFMPPAAGGLLPEYLQTPRPAILDVTPSRQEPEREGEGEEEEEED